MFDDINHDTTIDPPTHDISDELEYITNKN